MLRNPLMRLLEEIMEIQGPKEHWHIYATGHSMGGSLATLLAYELSVGRPKQDLSSWAPEGPERRS